jgi:hypothetical protein
VKLLLEIARAESDRENCEVAIHVRDAAGLMVSSLKLNMAMTWSSIH